MAGLNPPPAVQSVLSTPSRDRDRDRHPFPPTAHPSPAPSVRQTTSSSAGASFTSLSSSTTSSSAVQVSPTPLTVEGLLKQHATASDPKAAALDQAISERNVLSSQNTQLWKLIEKQRAGYNQILKELERIRGERDSYKSKLSALNAVPNGSSSKQQKSSTERTSRPSLDTVTSQTSSTSQSRQTYTRHNSDDSSATPRTSQYPQHLHSSRSFDSRSSENGFQSNAAHLTTPIRTASPPPPPPASAPNPGTRQFRPSPSPLVVPPRGENILLASSTQANSPDTFAFSKQPPTSDPNTTPNNSAPNGIYPSSVRPLAHPRKPSVADSFTSVVTSGSSVVSGSSPATSVSTHSLGANPTTTPSQQTYHTGYTPQTAPSGFNASPLPQDSRQRTPSSAAPLNNSQLAPPTIATPTNSASAPLSQQQIPQPQPNMLSAVIETRSHILSRDSRISLPDEARQYIVNMADSPVASPRTDHFSPRSKLSNSVFPSTVNGTSGESGRESEFLDMEEEDESDEESDAEGPGDVTAGASDPAFDTVRPINTQAAAGQTHHGPSTQPAYQPPHFEHLNNYSLHSNSSREDLDSIQSKRKEKSRVAAEEFPLPPPSNPYVQRQQPQQQGLASMDGRDQPSGQQSSLYAQQSSAPGPSPSKHAQSTADQYPHSSLSSSGNHQQQYQHPSSHDTHTSMQQQQQQQESPYAAPPPPPYQLQADSRGQQQQQPSLSHQEFPAPHTTSVVQAGAFRALPLLSSDLPHTNIIVSHSFVRPNDRGKEVLSFIVYVNPGNSKDGWKVEKMYSDVLSLDQRVRSSVGKGVGKKIANLPEGKLWKDHAPAKVDQRKAVLENYLQTLIHLPVKNNDEVIAFFTTDIVREQKQPVMQVGHKEGYLTKRGKNFGGWKTRFFVLQGPVLEYYDCRGGAHLGSISITGAQIARQHRTEKPPTTDDEKEYRHAFLIVEAKKGPGGNHPRHVLCAESDEDRDSWVEMLVRYYTGTYSEDLVFNPSSGLTSLQSNSVVATAQQPSPVSVNSMNLSQPRSSTSSNDMPAPMAAPSTPRSKPPSRGILREEISRGQAVPISQLPPDANNTKLFQAVPTSEDYSRSASPSRSIEPSPIDRQGPSAANYGFEPQKRTMERSALGLPSSLPDSSSPLSGAQPFQPEAASSVVGGQRANSELGHYPDLQPNRGPPVQPQRQQSPEHHRTRERDDGRRVFQPSLNTVAPSPTTVTGSSATGTPPPDRAPSPEKLDASGKVKISGPMNGAPIPSGFKFGGKDTPSADSSSASANNDRREKAKSRSFWGFGKGDKGQPHATFTPRAVFGVPLEEALEVAQVCNLPAIVFRSIQYLQAKKADQEEGIYRLSGSSAVIKSLKDRFNNEGDVDLLASDEYWDPHAIAGLLKSFLRELPSSILTRDLHLKFLAVIDFVDPQERIKELSQLIAALPLANYSLLRALTAHLILIVQNSNVNKMTMRNVGIVFSPTLGIPAGVFSLMLGEFNRVFDVDADTDDSRPEEGGGLLEHPSEALRRNSRQYTDAAADQVLGLSGRTLSTSAEETQSDGDDFSIQDESGTETTEGDATVESSSSSPASVMMQRDHGIQINTPDSTPNTPTAKTTSRAANVAASRGLNVAVTTSERGNRHSRMMGLPLSPRPHTQSHSPSRGDPPSNNSPTPARSE